MSRGVQPINLNQGQDFQGALNDLASQSGNRDRVGVERGAADDEESDTQHGLNDDLKTAEHLAHHAPTNLDPEGPKWYERAPVISRLLSVYDRMRDFPQTDSGSK